MRGLVFVFVSSGQGKKVCSLCQSIVVFVTAATVHFNCKRRQLHKAEVPKLFASQTPILSLDSLPNYNNFHTNIKESEAVLRKKVNTCITAAIVSLAFRLAVRLELLFIIFDIADKR